MKIIKYEPRGAPKSFWHKLYGYNKGKYSYPGVLSKIPHERIGTSVIKVEDAHARALENFLKAWNIAYEIYDVEKRGVGRVPPKPEMLTFNTPTEVLRERLKDFGNDLRELRGIVRHAHVRDAVEDTERFGY